MQVSSTTQPATATDADTVAVGVFEDGETGPQALPPEAAELLSSGEARRSFKALGLTHAAGKRWLVVGLGKRGDLTAERARVAAAVARDRTRELSAKALCWELPGDGDPAADRGCGEGAGAVDEQPGAEEASPGDHLIHGG